VSGWPAALDQLGAELEEALARKERQRGWLHLPRFVPPIVLALLLLAAAAVGTSGVIREGVPVPWADSGKRAPQPLPLESVQADDPLAGPAWGIRLAMAGPLVCEAVGQVIGGRIGVIRGRVFHALPGGFRDGCARVRPDGALVRWSQYPGPNVGRSGARTVVHGVAGRDVVRVEVLDGPVSRTLPTSRRRAFVAAFRGLRSRQELEVRVTLKDGTTSSYGGAR
jgi:hypothetical protein